MPTAAPIAREAPHQTCGHRRIGVRAESALVRTHGQHERAVGSPVHHGGPTTGSWAQSSPGAHDYPSAMLVPAFIPHDAAHGSHAGWHPCGTRNLAQSARPHGAAERACGRWNGTRRWVRALVNGGGGENRTVALAAMNTPELATSQAPLPSLLPPLQLDDFGRTRTSSTMCAPSSESASRPSTWRAGY